MRTLPPTCAVVMKSGNLNFLEPYGPLQACNGTALLLPFTAFEMFEVARRTFSVSSSPMCGTWPFGILLLGNTPIFSRYLCPVRIPYFKILLPIIIDSLGT